MVLPEGMINPNTRRPREEGSTGNSVRMGPTGEQPQDGCSVDDESESDSDGFGQGVQLEDTSSCGTEDSQDQLPQ